MLARSPLQVAACATLNHLLLQQPGANSRLKSHAGKYLRLRSGALDLRARIDDNGHLIPAEADTIADATLTIAPHVIIRRHDPATLQSVKIGGDQALATDVGKILQNLKWDFEDDLSRVFGDLPGRFMAERVRELDAWGRRALTSLGHNFAEYWIYETPLIASRGHAEELILAISETRDAVERLEKRVARLLKS